MAIHTKHPVSAPPAAPVREKTGHLLLRGWCVVVLFLAFTGAGWAQAAGPVGSAAVVAAATVVSLVVWLVTRPFLQWRRLPWIAFSFVAWAGLSIAWSAWPAASALTWLLLAATTFQGVFIAASLTWRDVVRAIASALKWVVGLSLALEAARSLFGPLPFDAADGSDASARTGLIGRGPIQGVAGDADLLGTVMTLALIVFAIRYTADAPRRRSLLVWIAAAAILLYRTESAMAYLAAAGAAVVLGTVLLMRTTKRPGERTRWYVLYAAVGAGGALAAWFGREGIFSALGRGGELSHREEIRTAVLERAGEHPVIGWGFATPWPTWDPGFDGVAGDATAVQAHSAWIDIAFQLGGIGVALLALSYLAFVWRSWFFAVDRPRYDLRADRPYSPLSLLPTLAGAVLLVEGVAESWPLMTWGWLLLVLLGSKIKQAPLVGVGPMEQSLAIERGDRPARTAG